MPNVFETNAKISLDSKEFDEGLDNSKNKISVFADILRANLVEKGIGLAIDGFQRLGNAVIGTVQQAVSSYSNYEQLVGGVETLFKESAGIVQDYAMEAYKNAGIGANQYMETVTSFSASLIQSLGGDTKQAAELSNRAIIDMSDNANKMSTNMESIMNAYMGFSKQNYTMLDNLKLGYGGTKTEMERLVAEAATMTEAQRKLGITVDANSMSFANIVNAISVVQEQIGIAGTTADEAATTVEGSMKMVKSAWADLLTSIAGGGKGMSEAIAAFVDSAKIYMGNLIPVVQEALYGIGDLVRGLAPSITDALPELVNTVLPNILDAVAFLIDSLAQNLPEIATNIVNAIISILPDLVTSLIEIINSLLDSIIPAVINLGIQLVLALGQGLTDNAEMIFASIITLLDYIIKAILDNLPMIIEVGMKLLLAISEGILNNMMHLSDTIMTVIATLIQIIVEQLPQFLELGVQILANIALGIVMAIPMLLVSIGRVLGIVDDAKRDVATGANKMNSIVDDSGDYISDSMSDLSDIINSTKSTIENTTNSLNELTDESRTNAQDISADIVAAVKETKKSVDSLIVSGVMVTLDNGMLKLQEFVRKFDSLMDHIISKLKELDDIDVRPTIDASGIESACSDIVSAVNQAINALNSLGSASASASFGGGHASGGWMQAGMTYLVGELGPELVTPSRSGYVHTADETASMLGSSSANRSIVININGDIYDDERSLMEKFQNAISTVLDREMAYA